jgi:GxxExxY protein
MVQSIIKTPFDELTYKVIGCAMEVHKALGPGLRENSYQKALSLKLLDASLSFDEQKLIEVFENSSSDRLVGYYIPDFMIENSVILEIKALNGLNQSHIAQIIGYLAVTGCAVGLLINFGERSLRFRRIFPPKKIIENLVNRQWLFVPDWLKNQQNNND